MSTPRFTIRREKVDGMPFDPSADWIVRDRQRPAFRGKHGSFALAIAGVDRRLREERGMPPRLEISTSEIRAEMTRRQRREALATEPCS